MKEKWIFEKRLCIISRGAVQMNCDEIEETGILLELWYHNNIVGYLTKDRTNIIER